MPSAVHARVLLGTPFGGGRHDAALRLLRPLAAFEHGWRLGKVHDHLSATKLNPGFIFSTGLANCIVVWWPSYLGATANTCQK